MISKYFPYSYIANVFLIDFDKLYKDGFRGLIFDIDNTLVHHGDTATKEVEQLFVHLKEIGFKSIFLSDNSRERVENFNASIQIPYIFEAGKPDPSPFKKAISILGVKPEQAIVIGDQIFTDILGANRASIPSILVHYIETGNEKRIGIKRYIEKAILGLYNLSRKYKNRLGL